MLRGFSFVNGRKKSNEPGVNWCTTKQKWRVSVQKEKKRFFGGNFDRFEDAVQKRDELNPRQAQQSKLICSGIEIKKCQRCKLFFPIEEFHLPEQKTLLKRERLTRCHCCRAEYIETHHSSEGCEAYKRNYAKRRFGNERTEEDMAKKRRHSDLARGCATQKLAQERKKQRLKTDPSLRIVRNIRNRLSKCLRGKTVGKKSKHLCKYTEFADYDHIRAHFSEQVKMKPGMTMQNYGRVWSVAHRIPLVWYNRRSVEDLKRANSIANLGCDFSRPKVKGEKSNNQKGIDLPPDEVMIAQGRSSWPSAWGRMLPSKHLRAYVLKRVRRGRFKKG